MAGALLGRRDSPDYKPERGSESCSRMHNRLVVGSNPTGPTLRATNSPEWGVCRINNAARFLTKNFFNNPDCFLNSIRFGTDLLAKIGSARLHLFIVDCLRDGARQVLNGQLRALYELWPDAQLRHPLAPVELVDDMRNDHCRDAGIQPGSRGAKTAVMNNRLPLQKKSGVRQ